MGCVILRDRVFRDAEVLARVLCCRDAQARTSFVHLDHLEGCGHVHPRFRLRFRWRTTTLLPIQKYVLENMLETKHRSRAVATVKGSTASRAVACMAKKLHVHPCCRPVRRKKIRSLSSVTVSSIVQVTIDNQRSAPGYAALRRSGATDAPVKTTLHECCGTNMRRESEQ